MDGFSFVECIVIFIVAVIVLGPKKLPDVARKIGHYMGMLRRASDEFKNQLMSMDQAMNDGLKQALPDPDAFNPIHELHDPSGDYQVQEELPLPLSDEAYEPQDAYLAQDDYSDPTQEPSKPKATRRRKKPTDGESVAKKQPKSKTSTRTTKQASSTSERKPRKATATKDKTVATMRVPTTRSPKPKKKSLNDEIPVAKETEVNHA